MILFTGLSRFSGHFYGDGPSPLNRDTAVLSANFLFLFNLTRFSRGHVLEWIPFIVEKEVQK